MSAWEFIANNIDKTIKAYKEDEQNTLLFTPYPYTTPCSEGTFQEMYYWDTYFTNKALFHFDKSEQVLNNVLNFDFLLTTYGRIPNGNRIYYLNRSQPPFFGLMMSDLLDNNANSFDEEKAFDMLEREYSFWMEKRTAPNGLNHYSCDLDNNQCIAHFGDKIGESDYEKRTGILLERTPDKCRSVLAECESGWDFTPRFKGDCLEYNPVDLNCLLYADEVLLSKWGKRKSKGKYYAIRAERRKSLMDKYMLSDDGIYYDYNFVKGTRSDNISCAGFFPAYVGLPQLPNALKKLIGILEREYGIVAGLTDKRVYQWAEPNGWAPLTYVAVIALYNLDLYQDAFRIAQKFVSSVDNIFNKTNRLWEKYNAETGNLDVVEYEPPEMLGWTAGAYVALKTLLNNMQDNKCIASQHAAV